MSDARPAPRHPAGVGALAGFSALPAARESALTELLAARAGELAREARRVVRAYEVAPADRATALDAVAAVQRALLLDVVAGRTSIDPRTWTPVVRAESARAVRRAAAQGALTVAPHRQRLATQRAALLAVRENASVGVPAETGPEQVLAAVPGRPESSATAASTVESLAAAEARALRSVAGPHGPARHARRPAGAAPGRRLTARRSARWGAAALLSSVTIVVGAAVAPAEERPADAPGTVNVSFVDRLTLPIIGLWENLVPGSKAQDPAEVPTPEAPDAVVPAPPAATPEPTPTPDATVPDAAVVPVVPTTPTVPDVPDVPVAPAPGAGSGGSWSTQGDGRPGNGGGRHDHDHDKGRGEGHERDERRDKDDDDDDDRQGHGRDKDQRKNQGKDRDTGRDKDRDDDRQDDGRGAGRSDDRQDGTQDGRDQDRRTHASTSTDKARSRGRAAAGTAVREESSPRA